MSEQSKQIVLRAMGRLDLRDVEGVVSECAPDCRWHGFSPGPDPLDTAGYKDAMSAILNAVGDSRFPIDAIVAEGNNVAVQHRLVGTHTGEFRGVAATGRAVTVPAIAVFEVDGNAISDVSLHADMLGLLMQIGAIPGSGEG